MEEMRKIREAWSKKKTVEEVKIKKAGRKKPDMKKKEEPKKMNLIMEMWKKRDLEEKLEKSKEVEHARKETRIQESPQVNLIKNNPPGLCKGGGEAEDQELRKEDLEGETEIRKKEVMAGIVKVNLVKNNPPGLRRGRGEAKDQKWSLRKEDLEGEPETRKNEVETENRKEEEAEKKESEAEAEPEIQVELNLDAGIRKKLEGREARKTGIKEGSEVRKKEAESGAIPKVRLDLDPGSGKENEERRGLQEWRRIGLGRKRKAEDDMDIVRKDKARPRKTYKSKESLNLQQNNDRENKVSPLISRFNFSSSSKVGHGEVRGGGGVRVRDSAGHGDNLGSGGDGRVMGEHPHSIVSSGPCNGDVRGGRGIRDSAGHGDNLGSDRDIRVKGEHPHSTVNTGPRIGRVGERISSVKSKILEGQGDKSDSSPVCTGREIKLRGEISGSTAVSTDGERALHGR